MWRSCQSGPAAGGGGLCCWALLIPDVKEDCPKSTALLLSSALKVLGSGGESRGSWDIHLQHRVEHQQSVTLQSCSCILGFDGC